MSENNGLPAMAATVGQVSEERRRELRSRLKSVLPPRQCFALVEGLRLAYEAVEKQWPDAAKQIQEVMAVAADHALDQKAAFEEADKLLTPEVRAQIAEDADRVARGELETVPFEDVLRELEEMQRQWDAERQPGKQSAAS